MDCNIGKPTKMTIAYDAAVSLLKDRITQAFANENERRRAFGEHRLTKTDLWKVAKVSSSACSHWFSGGNEIDLAQAMKIAPLLRVNAYWLFDGSGAMDVEIKASGRRGKKKLDSVIPENEEEALLLDAYRAANVDQRAALIAMARTVVIPPGTFVRRTGKKAA